MSEFKIESGVEIPKATYVSRRKYPFHEMKVGDSFLVPFDKKDGVTGSARSFCLRYRPDLWFKIREDGKKLRVWLVLKEPTP